LVVFTEYHAFKLVPHPQFSSLKSTDEKAMRRCLSSDYTQLHLASSRQKLMGPDQSSVGDAVIAQPRYFCSCHAVDRQTN
jgi:hypothetical protein